MQFTYRAKQGRQSEASGVIEAVDLSTAVHHLKQMGLYPLEIVPLEQKSSSSPGDPGRPLSRGELSLWARTLGQGIAAGLSLTQALHLLGTQEEGRSVGHVASQLEKQVTAGVSLGDAMGRMNPPFSPVAVSLVHAGETSGALEEVLEALAVQVEGEDDLISKVKAAFAYPIFVLVIGFGFMLFSNWVVLPRLVSLFQETGQQLPLMTRLMMGFVNTFAWVIVLLGVVAFAVFAWMRWGGLRLPLGIWGVAILSQLPVFGRMIAQMGIARMSATLGLLLEHGLPLPESLRLVSETIPRPRLKEQILQTRRGVVEGVSVSEGLRGW